MTSNQLFENITKDMNGGAKRIANKPDVLNDLSLEDLQRLDDKLAAYVPKTELGKSNRVSSMRAVTKRISKLSATAAAPTTEENATDEIGKGEMVANQTVVLEMHVRMPGYRKSIDPKSFAHRGVKVVEDEETTAKKKRDFARHEVFQQTVGKEFLNPIFAHRNKFIQDLKEWCVPSRLLAYGHYLVPAKMVAYIDEQILRFMEEHNNLVAEFGKQYRDGFVQKEAKERLGLDYDENKYMPWNVLRTKYDVSARWRAIDVPSAIKDISKEMYEREKEKINLEWADTFEEVRDALRVGFQDLVSSFSDVLGTDEKTGKPKIFQKSTVENLKQFLTTFENRDLTNDESLTNLVKQAKELINNVDPQGIRKNEDLRKSLSTSFDEIAKKAGELVEVRKRKRKIKVD